MNRDSVLLHCSRHLNDPGGTDIKGIDFTSSFSWFLLWTLSEDSKVFLSCNQDTYKLYLSGGIYLEPHICSPVFITLSLTVLSCFKWLSFLERGGSALKFAPVKAFSLEVFSLEECITIVRAVKEILHMFIHF